MAPEYPDGIVIHSPSAADNVGIIRHLMADDKDEYIAELKAQQRIIRENYLSKEARKELLTLEEARKRRHIKKADEIAIPSAEARKPLHTDNHSLLHPKGGCLCCDPLVPLINWHFFFSAWGIKGHFPEVLDDPEKGSEARKLWHDAQQLLDKIIRLRLLRLQMKAQILPAWSDDEDNIVIKADDGKEYRLPMRRSLNDEEETKCLADYLTPSLNPSPRGIVTITPHQATPTQPMVMLLLPLGRNQRRGFQPMVILLLPSGRNQRRGLGLTTSARSSSVPA